MSAEPETTLAWAEFLWQVVREAPETAALYIALFIYWQSTRKPKGRIIHLELSDSVSISDSLTATAGPQRVTVGMATETDTALPLRTPQTVVIGRAVETNTAMPLKVVGGAPS
jgi:hypothetical protein